MRRKEKYTLNDYYKYAIVAQQIMSGWLGIDKEGRTFELGHGGIEGFNKEWNRNIAYHHWFNQDDLIQLFYKLGLTDKGIEWILEYNKKIDEVRQKLEGK